jgi:hypothetical protein
MPNDPGADDGPETMADFGPEIVRTIGDFREGLGLPRRQGFLDDSLATPVDRELVRAYVDRTLGSEQSAQVLELTTKYRTWNQEVHGLLLARARAEGAGDSPGDH